MYFCFCSILVHFVILKRRRTFGLFVAGIYENDGIRPIAVGEVLRRMIVKVVLKQAMPEIPEFFPPLQLGVGVSDAVTHLVLGAHGSLRLSG